MLLPCAACNSLLGLDETIEVPPADAPHYVCDPLPAFIAGATSFLANCSDYTTDSHHDKIGIAFCPGGGGNGGAIMKGPPGSMEMTAVDFDSDATIKEVPRLAPAGDALFVRSPVIPVPGTASFRIFLEGSDGIWSEDKAITFADQLLPSMNDKISTPTGGTIERHIIVLHIDPASTDHTTFIEYAESKFNGWKPQHTYGPGDLGVITFSDPYLSEDGLALWFPGADTPGEPGLFASIRTDVGSEFPKAIRITTPPESSLLAPFVTRDCARLYFGVGSDTSFVVH